jgi:hypothetical protein
MGETNVHDGFCDECRQPCENVDAATKTKDERLKLAFTDQRYCPTCIAKYEAMTDEELQGVLEGKSQDGRELDQIAKQWGISGTAAMLVRSLIAFFQIEQLRRRSTTRPAIMFIRTGNRYEMRNYPDYKS